MKIVSFFASLLRRQFALLSAAILASTPVVWAQADPGGRPAKERCPLLERDFLTGDWSGVRGTMHDHGIDFSGNYIGDAFGNTTGGIRRGATYDALLILALDFDLQKLAGWTGAQGSASFAYPHGRGPSAHYTGDVGVVSNLDFYNSARLFEAWIQQTLFEERFSLRAGLIFADEEFAASQYSGLFINSGFGVPTALAGNMPAPCYAISALGVRFEVRPLKGWVARFGLFDGNPAPGVLSDPTPGAAGSNEFNRTNTQVALRHDEGAFFMGEIGFEFNQPEPDAAPFETRSATPLNDKSASAPAAVRGLSGRYFIGAAYHTDTFSDIYDVTLAQLGSSLAPTTAHRKKGNGMVYAMGEQEIWREHFCEPERGSLGIFARAAFAPDDRNFFNCSCETGLHYTGPFEGRDQDMLGLGFGYFGISDRVADAMRRANAADRTRLSASDYEAVIELTYNMKLAPWWSLQPDVQWIIHPGGSDAYDDALVVGLRSAITF